MIKTDIAIKDKRKKSCIQINWKIPGDTIVSVAEFQ